ncbi:MAG TPA: LysR family transcriptional regulator [Stellaceae bacterium]|nr:LysR family transcriptional regulator [Stellaceae bacterium]
MTEIHIGDLDLNLLRVFDTLIEVRSVTRAGERLGLSQSAISHALNRLRYVLKDELFVRGPDGMQATARAADMAPRLRQGLLQLELALAPAEFVALKTERRFTFTCTEYAGAVVLPGLIARLRAEAPRAEVRVLPSNLGVAESLRAGRADLAIGSYRRIPEWAAAEALLTDSRVWVVNARHPATREQMTLERLAELPHLVISATGEDERAIDGYVAENGLERMVTRNDAGIVQGLLAARGLNRTVAVTTPHFLAALVAISHSDIAALLPRRLADTFADRFGLKLIEPPYPSPSFELMSIWQRDVGEQPAVAWVRRILREVAANL